MMDLRANIRKLSASLVEEDGFGIIEGLVAAVILIVSVLAIYSANDAATRATFRAQQSQVELARAQQEMERIQALDYQRIALTSMPDSSSDPESPLNRVSNGYFNLNRSGTADYARLVVNTDTQIGGEPVADGSIKPGPESFTSGDVEGKIWRFVVWRKNPGCPSSVGCTGQDIRRVIIVVKPNDSIPGRARKYIEIASDFVDPNANVLTNVPPAGTSQITAQQFWLSDTPCASSGDTIRQPITADHPLHNTLGTCNSGPWTGGTEGAPDALLTSVPPGDPGADSYDYASDPALEPLPPPADAPLLDRGIQLNPQDQTSPPCKFDAVGSTSPQTKSHVWVSNEMPFMFEMTGAVTLTFFSRTINEAEHPGKLCIWLFERIPGSQKNDRIIGGDDVSTQWTYQDPGDWPTLYDPPPDFPTPLISPVTLIAPATDLRIRPQHRLGLAISADRSVSTSALEIMYDHPSFPSRLSVSTTTHLP